MGDFLLEQINSLDFFKGKSLNCDLKIYKKDEYPCCVFVQADDIKYKVRFLSKFNPNSVVREIYALKFLSKYLPNVLPKIVTADPDAPHPYIVESYLPGISLDKIDEIKSPEVIADKISEFFISLHKLEHTYFFDLANFKCVSYFDFMTAKINNHIDYQLSVSKELDKVHNDVLMYFNKYRPIFKGIKPSFLHYDVKPQNIIFDEVQNNVFFIDFEYSRFGHYLHDIYRTEKLFLAHKKQDFNVIWELTKSKYYSQRPSEHTDSFKNLYYLYNDFASLTYYLSISNEDGKREALQKIYEIL